MKFRRISIILLALIMVLGIFSGCDFVIGQGDPIVSETPEVPESSEEVVVKEGYDAAAATFPADTLIMTVDGSPVYWDEFFYWFTVNISYIETNYGTIEDWSEVVEGESWAEFAISETIETARLYRAVEKKAAEMGITLTAEDEEYIQYYWEMDVATYGDGDEEAFIQYLTANYMTEDIYYYMNKVATLYYSIMDEVYGAEGEKMALEEVLAYADSYGFMQTKHILLLTTDDDGNALSDEEKTAVYSQMEDFLTQLDAAPDDELEAVFDGIMNEYSEDGGLASFPDGYLFMSGEMMEEFENATLELGAYEYSGIVETDYGYHIILRLPINRETVPYYYYSYYGYTYPLQYYPAAEAFDSLMYGWTGEAVVEYSEAYNSLDANALFEF